jgi:hypothetical protein
LAVWLIALLIICASARWPAAGLGVQACLFALCAVGLLALLQGGFVVGLLLTIFEVPLLALQGVFGIARAVLYP